MPKALTLFILTLFTLTFQTGLTVTTVRKGLREPLTRLPELHNKLANKK